MDYEHENFSDSDGEYDGEIETISDAIKSGSKTRVREFLQHHQDLDFKTDTNGKTVYHEAVRKKSKTFVKLLKQKVPERNLIYKRDIKERSPLY